MLLYNTIESDIVHIVQSCIVAGYNMIIFLTFSYLDLRDVLHSHPPRQHHLASWPQAQTRSPSPSHWQSPRPRGARARTGTGGGSGQARTAAGSIMILAVPACRGGWPGSSTI